MESVKLKLRLTNPDTMVDEVHEYVGKWEVENDSPPEGILLRIALQEWISNLLQHADFGSRNMEVVLDTWREGGVVKCVIEDNSVGFALEDEPSYSNGVDATGERGRGLWMIREVATEGLNYEPIDEGRHRLTMVIGNNHELWDNILS